MKNSNNSCSRGPLCHLLTVKDSLPAIPLQFPSFSSHVSKMGMYMMFDKMHMNCVPSMHEADAGSPRPTCEDRPRVVNRGAVLLERGMFIPLRGAQMPCQEDIRGTKLRGEDHPSSSFSCSTCSAPTTTAVRGRHGKGPPVILKQEAGHGRLDRRHLHIFGAFVPQERESRSPWMWEEFAGCQQQKDLQNCSLCS